MADAYSRLHQQGWAHSIEIWQENRLAGGLYGLAIGRAFFGESMFSRQTNASKAAMLAFVSANGLERLRDSGLPGRVASPGQSGCIAHATQ